MSFPLMLAATETSEPKSKASEEKHPPLLDEDFLLLLSEMDLPTKSPLKVNAQANKQKQTKPKPLSQSQQQRQQEKVEQWLFWLEQEIPQDENKATDKGDDR
ncbi:hypothetical protein [Kangiella sp. TOML190]|uniref:hypothetical protein n=1 Tax=Kangiella sp. TOML190 TaxID=2931351 RepID=UPI00203B11A3|nr:hypothetical protein [Kangiella sp. TOML190]